MPEAAARELGVDRDRFTKFLATFLRENMSTEAPPKKTTAKQQAKKTRKPAATPTPRSSVKLPPAFFVPSHDLWIAKGTDFIFHKKNDRVIMGTFRNGTITNSLTYAEYSICKKNGWPIGPIKVFDPTVFDEDTITYVSDSDDDLDDDLDVHFHPDS